MVDYEPLIGAEQLVRDNKRADGIIAGATTGIANHVRIAFCQTRELRDRGAHPCRLGWQTGERVAERACFYHRTLLRSFDSPPRHHQEPWSWGRLPELMEN